MKIEKFLTDSALSDFFRKCVKDVRLEEGDRGYFCIKHWTSDMWILQKVEPRVVDKSWWRFTHDEEEKNYRSVANIYVDEVKLLDLKYRDIVEGIIRKFESLTNKEVTLKILNNP